MKLSRALGDTENGLSNTEIDKFFSDCGFPDPGPGTKWKRLVEAFGQAQKRRGARTPVLAFIRKALAPSRYVRVPERFETLRSNLNRAIVFYGLAVGEDGALHPIVAAKTISEATRKADELRATLITRHVHQDVLDFCRAELVADNYFHAVLEAVKSVSNKLRSRTGLTSDGAELVEAALSGQAPKLQINALSTESEKSEQKGFANLLKGTFGMFRNPTAHEAKILWQMKRQDAEDLLSLLSLIHRRLDNAY